MSERDFFIAALQHDSPAARAAYLDHATAGDAALRQRIEHLLQAHENAGSFLSKPLVDEAATGAYTPHPDAAAGLPGAQAASAATEGPGTRIGQYKLLQQIGEGGMGIVWMAEQQEPVRRMVALKVIKAGMDSKEVVARFDAERQALAVMDHQNIAKVFDAGTTASGRLYFVMELVKGTPITKYCDEHRLTPRERLELFMPVCHALQHAHQKGIIHRDIKPSNVLVAPYDGKPVVKVIDFGIAKATGQRLTGRTMFTEFGAVVGTLEYMSPEQAELNNQDIDTRSDIYSLGVLLYELLTGTTPLPRDRLKQAALNEALRMIREEEPPNPSTRLSSSEALPSLSAQRKTEPAKMTKMMRGEMDWIVMKALEKDRTRRYETASGFAVDVQRYLEDEPVLARPTSAGYRLQKFARRNKGPLVAVAFVLLALVVGVIGTTWGLFEARDQRDVAQQARDAERERAGELAGALKKTVAAEQAEKRRAGELAVALKQAEQARETVEDNLATNTMMLARSHFEQDNAGLADSLLQQVPAKYRGASWSLLKNYVAGSLFTVFGHTQQVNSVSYSPDGQTLASASADKTVRLWDARSGQELRALKGHTESVIGVSYSPDGQTLASASLDKTVRLWDAKSGQVLHVLKGHTGFVRSVSYSPDGQTLASASVDMTVRLWDAKSGQELRVLKGHTSSVQSVTYSRDGQTLASASFDKTVRLWDANSGQELRVLNGHTSIVNTVSYSPDGRTLASASYDKTVRLWDAISGQELRVLKGHADQVTNVAYSPDAQTLASSSYDKMVRLWDVKSGQELGVLKGHTGHVKNVCYRPDGQSLASAGADGTVRAWGTKSGQELNVLRGHSNTVGSVIYSPDGQTLASASYDKTVRLWDAKSGRELRVLEGHTDYVASVSYSPDGQTLASASYDKTVRLWDAKSGQELRVLKGDTGFFYIVSYSPDGRTLATASLDKTVRLWDTKSGQELRVIEGHASHIINVSYSPDGQTLASASSDKRTLTLRLWDAKGGKEQHVLRANTSLVYSVSYSPDGKTLASASTDNTVRLWDAKSGQELRVLKGHTNQVLRVSYSPDGQTLASASTDNTVRLWDAKSGQELRVLKGHTENITSVSYSPDGQTLASASDDGTVRLWDVRSLWPVPGQPLTPQELSFRRWVTRADLQWHIEKRMEFEKENTAFAAAFHRSWEQHARGVLAFEAGDFNRAYAHFIAAAALKPMAPDAR